MAFKSIIDIDINDAKFKDFLTAFQKYKEKAEDAPEDWHKLARAISGTSEEMRHLGRAQKSALGGADRDALKLSRSLKHVSGAQQRFTKHVKAGSAGLKGFSRYAGDAALAMAPLTDGASLVVAAIVAIGVAAAKATLSLDKLTASKFKSARELGMTVGQQQAFQTYGSQLFSNPDAMLADMRNAKMTVAGRAALIRMGFSPTAIDKDSPAQLAFQLGPKAHRLLKSVPQDVRGNIWENFTQGQLGGLNQASLFANTHIAQIRHYQAEYEKHEHAFAISTKTGRRAVNVTQAAGELRGKVVTGMENGAASKPATVAAMGTIRKLRTGASKLESAAHDVLQGASAVEKGLAHFVGNVEHWVDNLLGITQTALRHGKLNAAPRAAPGSYTQGMKLRSALQADQTKYAAFMKANPNWMAHKKSAAYAQGVKLLGNSDFAKNDLADFTKKTPRLAGQWRAHRHLPERRGLASASQPHGPRPRYHGQR